MPTKKVIEDGIREIKQKFGDWSSDIPLPHGVWTNGNQRIPQTRVKRVVQIAQDLCSKPLSQCRVLDLACLDGIFSIEFALHGAETLGVEIREANVRKAIFAKEVMNLKNLEFRQGDVRQISKPTHGTFDVILCSGIFYHLTAPDAHKLVSTMHSMSERLVIIDTHVALRPRKKVVIDGNIYYGETYREHRNNDNQQKKELKAWASWDNPVSFWFTRPSLVNLLQEAGFSSVYENFVPLHKNFGKPGLECIDRCTFVAVKSKHAEIITSPSANKLKEAWPEKSLAYGHGRLKVLVHRARLAFSRRRQLGALSASVVVNGKKSSGDSSS